MWIVSASVWIKIQITDASQTKAKKEIAFNEKEHAIETLGIVEGTWLEFLDVNKKRSDLTA
jgi:hypothetical protein